MCTLSRLCCALIVPLPLAVMLGSLSLGASSPAVAPLMPAPRYADGAPPGFSGGFGEQSCHACHFEAEPNQKPGQLTIAGVPERFTPGSRYDLTVTLSRPGMKIGGFQLAARFDNGSQAGTVAPGPDDTRRVKVETQSTVQYANQLRDNTPLPTPDTARWTLVWTAPMAGGPVQFHVAANAADSDESVRGDHVYTALVRSSPE